jgi:hypothetical protein
VERFSVRGGFGFSCAVLVTGAGVIVVVGIGWASATGVIADAAAISVVVGETSALLPGLTSVVTCIPISVTFPIAPILTPNPPTTTFSPGCTTLYISKNYDIINSYLRYLRKQF